MIRKWQLLYQCVDFYVLNSRRKLEQEEILVKSESHVSHAVNLWLYIITYRPSAINQTLWNLIQQHHEVKINMKFTSVMVVVTALHSLYFPSKRLSSSPDQMLRMLCMAENEQELLFRLIWKAFFSTWKNITALHGSTSVIRLSQSWQPMSQNFRDSQSLYPLGRLLREVSKWVRNRPVLSQKSFLYQRFSHSRLKVITINHLNELMSQREICIQIMTRRYYPM